MTEKEYIKKIFDDNKLSAEGKKMFKKVINLSSDKKKIIFEYFLKLRKKAGLEIGLLALYRQQVNCGFVLSDPLKKQNLKRISDDKISVNFIISFNPLRELRKNHEILIERGIILDNIDNNKLINKKNGIACYLCWKNILIQNPAEIIIKIKLYNEFFYVGANFAYITNNHFTIMNSKHIPQIYRKNILRIGLSFLDKTNGMFRIIYNGRAGASIKEHEHFQATTEKFPIEKIERGKKLWKTKSSSVYNPFYYLPLWFLESYNKEELVKLADKIITEWRKIDKNHTINLIFKIRGEKYSIFIFLRDSTKLQSKGKTGDMASFEVGGRIVLSTEEEKQIFEKCSLSIIEGFLKGISPDKKKVAILRKKILKYLTEENYEV